MLSGLTVILLVVSWLTTFWALERAADARALLASSRARPRHLPTKLARRATPRPVPPPEPLPDWITAPGPAALSACARTTRNPVITWPDPPAPTFAPQHGVRPDGTVHLPSSVAAGWDAWTYGRPTTELPVLVLSD